MTKLSGGEQDVKRTQIDVGAVDPSAEDLVEGLDARIEAIQFTLNQYTDTASSGSHLSSPHLWWWCHDLVA